MRVTESRMIEVASAAVGAARDRVATAGSQLSSGQRVELPSTDPTAWADGMRADARTVMSAARGTAIAKASGDLEATDGALSTVSAALARALELSIQMANGTQGATERANAASEILSLRDQSISAVNARGNDGEFLLAGSKGSAAPFDPNGVYQGDAAVRSIEASDAGSTPSTVSGSGLTLAVPGGVDVFDTLTKMAGFLAANNVTQVQGLIGNLHTAVSQVATVRTEVGVKMAALKAADDARQSFEVRLAETHAAALDADPVTAASELAQAQNALQTARTVGQQIIAATRPPQ